MEVADLHQGTEITAPGQSRRWIAVILDEQEVETVLEEYNEKHNTNHTIADLDMSSVVSKYTDALLESGGFGWDEMLKIVIEHQL